MRSFNFKKSISLVIAALMLFAVVLTGCGTSATPASSGAAATVSQTSAATTAAQVDSSKPVTLSVEIFAEDLDYWNKHIQDDSFKKALPNVKLDIQSVKDSDELKKTLLVRQSAKEMPDAFYLKPDHIMQLKDSLYLWDKSDPLVQMNKTMDQLKILDAGDGKYYGLPMKEFAEWVYYRKSIFTELGLQVPQTWTDFVNVAKKIQDSGKYQGIALGLKDGWPAYPFLGQCPSNISNRPNLDNENVAIDAPFAPGTPYYVAYQRFDQLIKTGAFGKALGISYSEAGQMFASKKAGIIVIGQYYYPDYVKYGGDLNDLGLFALPVVDKAGETNRQATVIDIPFALAKDSKNIDLGKKLLTWYFSPEIYQPYLTERTMTSTIKGIDAQNLFTDASKNMKVDQFIQGQGDEKAVKLQNEVKYDMTAAGQQMFSGKDYNGILADYDKNWAAARKKFGY